MAKAPSGLSSRVLAAVLLVLCEAAPATAEAGEPPLRIPLDVLVLE